MMMNPGSSFLLVLIAAVTTASAFVPHHAYNNAKYNNNRVATLKMAAADDAVAFYQTKYPDKKQVKELKTAFTDLAKVYGDDSALKMIKDDPILLGYNSKFFAPSHEEFAKTFGKEESLAMVKRNPGLLSLPPAEAAKAADSTMQLSYIVGVTKPAGPFLLYGTLGLICIPAVEAITGIPIRENLLSVIGM